jgi:hypothetical protein
MQDTDDARATEGPEIPQEVKPLRNKIKDRIGLNEDLDVFSEKNRPKIDQPLTVIRFFRLLGLWILSFALIASFVYGLLLAFHVFGGPNGMEMKGIVSWSLSGASCVGFLLLTIASEFRDRASDIQRVIAERRERMREFGLTEEQARLVEAEFLPTQRKGKKAKVLFVALSFAFIGLYAFFYYVFHVQLDVLATYGIATSIISVGFFLSGFAGEINVEIFRFEIFRLHVHEAAVGIFFIIVALPLVYFGVTVDKVLSAFYMFIGAWLMGRDWKDLSAGKIIERKKKFEQALA